MKYLHFRSTLILSFLLVFPTVAAQAQNEKPQYVQAFEEDLYNPDGGKTFKNSVMKRIDPSEYDSFTLKWHGSIGNTACLVYHAEDPTQNEETWNTNMKNIAIKLVKNRGKWVVNALNIKPGNKVKTYDFWLKAQGCKEK